MEVSLVLLTAVCAIVFIKLVDILYKRYQLTTLVDKIPGPRAYPIVGNALTFMRIKREERYEWFWKMCGQYEGGIFRIWMGTKPIIHLITPETVSVILPSRNLITKSDIYDFIHPWLGTGLLTSTGDKWQRHRKLITPTFHFNILGEFSGVISEKAEILKKCITSELENDPKKPIDMFVFLTRCALDVICESAMGTNINAQNKLDLEYSVALHSLTVQAVERIFRPWLRSDWIYRRTSRGQRFKNTVETTQKFTNQVISEKKMARKMQKKDYDEDDDVDKPKRQAFLDHLLDACERDNMPLTDDELREEVDTFMFAGHDTTAAAMSWALFCIGNHPEVEEKIHEEQLRVFGDSNEPATLHQISELKYLERVIKETLRLFPSAPSVSRTLTEDVEIAGYTIPKGTLASIQIRHVHRDPRHWPEPDKFNPDRFLPENSQGRHPFAYIPFSAGPRNCIGQKFAMMEQKIILTALLRTWRVKCLSKFDEPKCYSDLILRPQAGINICFTPKNNVFA